MLQRKSTKGLKKKETFVSPIMYQLTCRLIAQITCELESTFRTPQRRLRLTYKHPEATSELLVRCFSTSKVNYIGCQRCFLAVY